MRRLPWAIVVAAGLLAAAWSGETLRGFAIFGGWQATRNMLGMPALWAWLASMAIAITAFIRMWSEREPLETGHSFEVLSAEQRKGVSER